MSSEKIRLQEREETPLNKKEEKIKRVLARELARFDSEKQRPRSREEDPVILITAFEPFGGYETNSSQMILNALPSELPGIKIVKQLLPVSFERAPYRLAEVIRLTHPSSMIGLGQAAGRDLVTIEKIAINLMDSKQADADGARPNSLPVSAIGADCIFTNLPVDEMLRAMNGNGTCAKLSLSAGSYVCNTVMYQMVSQARSNDTYEKYGGFIHIPLLKEQDVPERAQALPKLPMETVSQAVLRGIQVLASQLEGSKEKSRGISIDEYTRMAIQQAAQRAEMEAGHKTRKRGRPRKLRLVDVEDNPASDGSEQ